MKCSGTDNVSFESVAESDIFQLRCQLNYVGDYVRTQFHCFTKPKMSVISSRDGRDSSTRDELTTITAFHVQDMQVSRSITGVRVFCSVQLTSNDSQHAVLYTSNWTSAAISLTSTFYSSCYPYILWPCVKDE